MKQAVNNALYTPASETIPPIAPTCPSGNCSWPLFDSLAICSQVNNVTDLLIIETNEIPDSFVSYP
jgi:hypothetical protein